jgi:hypothetical protein
MSDVRELLATDDTFAEVADLLFGGGGDQLITKMNPTQSDLSTHERKKRALTAGLSAVGAGAGAAGLGLATRNLGRSYRAARAGRAVSHAGQLLPKMTRGAAAKHTLGQEKFATGLIPLEAAGLGGEIMATRILHGDTKKKVSKGDTLDMLNQASDKMPTKGQLTRATVTSPKMRKKGLEYTKKTGGMLKKLPEKIKTTNEVEKQLDVVWEGEFAKADADKQQIFGWASVVEIGGQQVEDLQGDLISPDEMEKAGYSYVMKSRKGGDMHLRNEWQPIQKSEMIESFIVTPEKRDAMGLPDSVPTGWWVGFQVQDPEVWADIKSGKRTGFSIHGHGRRTPA